MFKLIMFFSMKHQIQPFCWKATIMALLKSAYILQKEDCKTHKKQQQHRSADKRALFKKHKFLVHKGKPDQEWCSSSSGLRSMNTDMLPPVTQRHQIWPWVWWQFGEDPSGDHFGHDWLNSEQYCRMSCDLVNCGHKNASSVLQSDELNISLGLIT